MIATDNHHIWVERHQPRDQPIHFLDYAHFAHEITALAIGIGFLDVQVKEIEVSPVLFQGGELIRWGIARYLQYLHPRELRNTPIHAIDRDRSSVQTITLGKGWQNGEFVEAA